MGRLGLRAVIQVRRRLFRPELRVISLIPDVLKGGSGRKVFRSPLKVSRKPTSKTMEKGGYPIKFPNPINIFKLVGGDGHREERIC